jgi:hypothetical protein
MKHLLSKKIKEQSLLKLTLLRLIIYLYYVGLNRSMKGRAGDSLTLAQAVFRKEGLQK